MGARFRPRLKTLLKQVRRLQLPSGTIAALLEAGPDARTIELGAAPGVIVVMHRGREVGTLRTSFEALPFSDRSLDGAVLTAVLGRVGNRAVLLREVWRVLEPGGRLVAAEARPDPDALPRAVLHELARRERFEFDRHVKRRFAYAAAFVKPHVTDLA